MDLKLDSKGHDFYNKSNSGDDCFMIGFNGSRESHSQQREVVHSK